MKNSILLFGIFLLSIALSSFSSNVELRDVESSYEIPENISAIMDKSCIMCHNAESKNSKAKLKLKLDELADMKVSKQISKLSKIAKEVSKGDMPPSKFTSKYPEKALSDEEKETLISWAKNYSEELAK